MILLYNVFLHPLHSFPGPLLFQATKLMKAGHMATGNLQFQVKALHEKYGPVVGIAPNELSLADPAAWKDIFGQLPNFYRLDDSMARNLISAERDQHAILRRLLAYGFSERSMLAQSPCISNYVDVLMQGLHKQSTGSNEAVDLNAWFNWPAFDIIGFLFWLRLRKSEKCRLASMGQVERQT